MQTNLPLTNYPQWGVIASSMGNKLVTFLVLVVMIAGAYFLGSYKTKVDIYEGKGVVPAATQNVAAPAPSPAPTAPTVVKALVNPDDPVKGDPKAKITIVEYSDFQCPFCGRFYKDTFPDLMSQYIDTGKVKFVYKNLAFLGQESRDAANAAFCAQEQNKFWEYHDKLFASQNGENQGTFAAANLKKFAAGLGLNTATFNSCLDANKYNARVDADIAEANQNGFQSTPSFAINSTPLVGAQPIAQFKTIIDSQL